MADTKKVLFIITKSVWGGAQRYVYDLSTNLTAGDRIAPLGGLAAKWNVVVAAGGSGPLFERLSNAGVRTINIKFLERDVNLLKEILSLISVFKILKTENPDIVHLNSSKIGGLGALAARTYQLIAKPHTLKTVFTVHGWAFNEDRNFLSKILIFASQWITAALCDKIIVISKHDYRQALKIPLISSEKFVLLPLGSALPENYFFTKDKSKKLLSKMLGEKLEKDDLVVGTIAELTKNKGLDYLIGAARKLRDRIPNLKYIIIGDGEDRALIRNKINSSGLADSVYLTGFLDEASRYIKSFDVFALPSLKEGLPYVLLEAMSAGLPVVATSVGGIPDLIEHKKSGYIVSPKNHFTLAEAIEETLPKSGAKIVKNIHKEKLENNFSLEKMIAGTIRVYES